MTKIILIVASVLSIYIYNGFRNNKIISDTEPCQRLSEEVNKYIIENIQYRDVDNLNGRAAIIGDSLLILARSNRTAFFAFDREQAGFYSSWKGLKDVLPSLILASCIFVYNDQIVYIGINQNWEEAIYIYDREFKLIKEMQFELKSFSPDYRYNNWLYGASQDAESRWGITKVNLDTLETETISLDSEHAPYGICRNYDGAIMFAVSSGDTPSIFKPQETVNRDGQNVTIQIQGRHDPVIVPRAVVVVESMAALAILDLMMLNMNSRMEYLENFYRDK